MTLPFLKRWTQTRRADFDREVLPHLDSMFALAMRLCRNERDAEDLVQDSVLRAFRFFHRFEQGTNCRAWLFKILHNTFVTRYRQRVREREVLDAAAHEDLSFVDPAGADPERELVAGILSDDVRRALDGLPEEFRTAVTLCDLEEFSYKEIAEIMDCPVGTVMSRLHRGRRMLRDALRSYAATSGIGIAESESNVIPMRRGEP